MSVRSEDQVSAVVERLAGEMVGRWRDGDRPVAEEFLDRCPDLWDRPDAALELIAEELALRDEHGLPASADELAGRFPRWPAQVRALFDCHRVLGPQLAPPEFPAPGEALGDFRLASELGRGAHGRVYLAVQPALSDRPVVLKVGPDTGGEHLSLARLQHTHIVPLYSAHEFPDRRLRALCLAYFGGATLADLLARADRPAGGKDLLAALRAVEPEGVESGPAWGFLERASASEAACWAGACLADALQYAHDRGLLHLDLKPSNVLIAADGVPMLLDFHLARPPLRAGEPAPSGLGGTPGYMAPELESAIRAVREGRPVPAGVDARSDVYSLGVLLREWLGSGRRRSQASVGLADVLARCTAADPADRYPTAAALAGDLRRHLSNLPLRGVGNRSVTERWGKWRRRRPHALPLALMLAALAAVAAGVAIRVERQADQARRALGDGEARSVQGRYAEAAETFRGGEGLIEGSPFHRPLLARLRESRRTAERGQAAAELHQFCEQVRPLYAAEVLAPGQAREVGARCADLWSRRGEFLEKLSGQPTPELEQQWRADLLDVAVLAAHLGAHSAPPGEAAHRQALATLDEAEAVFGPTAVLYLERARHARALGSVRLADEAGTLARSALRRGAWDHLAAGRALLAAGDVAGASAEVGRSLELDPRSLWASYCKGVCRLRLGDPAEAVAAFNACVALAPHSAWCFHNRGLAYTGADRPDRAVADFDRALTLDPALAPAYLGRAAAHHRAGRHASALADLDRAAQGGLPPAAVQYQRAVVLLATKDRPAAIASLRDCLRHDPGHQPARDLLVRLNAAP